MHDQKKLENISRDLYQIAVNARAAGARPATIKAIMAASSKALKDSVPTKSKR